MSDYLDQEEQDVKAEELGNEWDNPPSLLDLKTNYKDAISDHQTQTNKIQGWLDNLNIEGDAKFTPKDKNKSSIQPKLIRKQAEWRYSSLSEPFLSTPDIFNIAPVTFEDKESAEQNALILNNQFNNQLNKVKFVDEYVRAAVNEGTCIVRVGWDSEEEVTTETKSIYDFRPAPQMAQVHQEVHALMQENPTEYQQLPPEVIAGHEETMRRGQLVEAILVGSEEVEVVNTTKNQPTVKVCDYNRVIVDPTCEGDLDLAQFVIYEFETSYSDLERAGIYENIDAITLSEVQPSTNSTNEEDLKTFTFKDKPRKKFLAYEYWGYWDIDGSGVTKPIVATWVGDTLIRLEENPFPDKAIPFVVVPYLPVTNSVYGEPDGSLTEDNQRIIGAVTRGMVDIMAKNANGQRGIRKDALDISNRRKYNSGQDFEFNPNSHPQESIWMNQFADIPQSAQYMINLNTAEAESISGVKSFTGSNGGDALGTTATAVRGALDAISVRELGILRRLAEGMKQIGRKIIAMNAVWLSDEEAVRITNESFRVIRRDDLGGKFDLDLSISTAAADNQKAQELAFMLQTGAATMDPEEVRMIRAEIARLRKMPELAHKIENYQPQPDPIAQEKAQLENEKLKAEIAEIYAQAQQKQADAGKKASETDKNNLDFVEQETGTTQERELQKQKAQSQGNMELELVKTALGQQVPKQSDTK